MICIPGRYMIYSLKSFWYKVLNAAIVVKSYDCYVVKDALYIMFRDTSMQYLNKAMIPRISDAAMVSGSLSCSATHSRRATGAGPGRDGRYPVDAVHQAGAHRRHPLRLHAHVEACWRVRWRPSG